MKIPAEFLPKSWEMPPSARVIEDSASVVARDFDGETLNWLVALVEDQSLGYVCLWFRLLDTRFDAGFIAFGSRVYHPMPVNPKRHKSVLQTLVDSAWKDQFFGRKLCLNENGMLRREGETMHSSVHFACDGKGAWIVADLNDEVAQRFGLFKWNEPIAEAEFCRLSSYDLWKRLQEFLSDSENDVSFARKFVLMKNQERQELVFGESICSRNEFESLLRVIALQENLDQIPVGATLLVDSSDRSGDHFYWDDDGCHETSIGSKEFHRDVALLRERCFPIKEEFANRLCVCEWIDLCGSASQIRIPYPTAHEQLEAQLRWREWKQNHEKL